MKHTPDEKKKNKCPGPRGLCLLGIENLEKSQVKRGREPKRYNVFVKQKLSGVPPPGQWFPERRGVQRKRHETGIGKKGKRKKGGQVHKHLETTLHQKNCQATRKQRRQMKRGGGARMGAPAYIAATVRQTGSAFR